MIIDCETDPNKLIDEIGDRYFSVCEELILPLVSSDPGSATIWDCEGETTIHIRDDLSNNALPIAKALCTLLNQSYKKI